MRKENKVARHYVKKKTIIILITALLLTIFFSISLYPPQATFANDEDIRVSCYKGNPANNDYIGNVRVFKHTAAAATCNNVYYKCKGQCNGCMHDFDYVESVCYDNAGRMFLK
jgi:hypothetical protein